MAHYNFHKDLEESKDAVKVVTEFWKQRGFLVTDLHDDESKRYIGDLCIEVPNTIKEYVEVKYDIKSNSTGNLCFELYNGWGRPTGILITEANWISYVVKSEKTFKVYTFDANKLRSILFSPKNCKHTRLVGGGDGGKYKMLLVKESVASRWAEITGEVLIA